MFGKVYELSFLRFFGAANCAVVRLYDSLKFNSARWPHERDGEFLSVSAHRQRSQKSSDLDSRPVLSWVFFGSFINISGERKEKRKRELENPVSLRCIFISSQKSVRTLKCQSRGIIFIKFRDLLCGLSFKYIQVRSWNEIRRSRDKKIQNSYRLMSWFLITFRCSFSQRDFFCQLGLRAVILITRIWTRCGGKRFTCVWTQSNAHHCSPVSVKHTSLAIILSKSS